MKKTDKHLVRCAGCGYNFETERYGEISCPYCKSKIWIDPPEGYQAPEDIAKDASTDEQNMEPVSAPDESQDILPPDSNDSPQDEDLIPQTQEQQRLEDLHRILESTIKTHMEQLKQAPAWEQKGGILSRFTRTIKDVLSAPSLFFASLPDSGYARAFLFGWITCTVGVAFFCLYGLWQIDMNYQANLEMLKANEELSKMGVSPEHVLDSIKELLGISLVAAPVLGAINLLVTSVLNHLGILLVSGRRLGLKVTMRATAYSLTPLLMLGVPVIGNLLGGIWAIVLQVIAMSQVHKLPTSRASLAVLLPLFSVLMLLMTILP